MKLHLLLLLLFFDSIIVIHLVAVVDQIVYIVNNLLNRHDIFIILQTRVRLREKKVI